MWITTIRRSTKSNALPKPSMSIKCQCDMAVPGEAESRPAGHHTVMRVGVRALIGESNASLYIRALAHRARRRDQSHHSAHSSSVFVSLSPPTPPASSLAARLDGHSLLHSHYIVSLNSLIGECVPRNDAASAKDSVDGIDSGGSRVVSVTQHRVVVT